MSRFLTELQKACKSSYVQAIGTPLWRYVTSGDEQALSAAKSKTPRYGLYWVSGLWDYLPQPEELATEEKRALHAGAVLNSVAALTRWVAKRIEKSPQSEQAYLEVFREAFGKEDAEQRAAAIALIEHGPKLALDDPPTPIEKFLLSFSDSQMKLLVQKCGEHNRLLELLLVHTPERVTPLVDFCVHRLPRCGKLVDPESCRLLLKYCGTMYEDTLADAFRGDADIVSRFWVGGELSEFNPKRYRDDTRAVAQRILQDRELMGSGQDICKWLVDQFGRDSLQEVGGYLSRHNNSYRTEPTMQYVVKSLQRSAKPAVTAALDNPNPSLRLAAIKQLIQWGDEEDHETIRQAFENGLAESNSQQLIAFLVAAGQWDLTCLQDPVWKLTTHKSKPVRQTAARMLGRLGDAILSRAQELLAAKKSATRSCAVTMLGAVDTKAATKLLEERLDEEGDEEVRDQILLALETARETQGKKITRKEIDRRIERTLTKLDGPVAAWLDETQLPPLKYAKEGKPLSAEAVRYLLYRQSRAKEIRPDVEAKPLYALIDRTGSGAFALAVWGMFTASPMEASDRWVLAIAGLLGDDRLVTPLMQQIREWVDGGRGKMAEYAVQALALLATDVALCAVDTLSIRYRSKQKNIGKAASESFAEAAERLGVTVEELGDRVVPWLGFEPNVARIIEHGEKRIEVGIGMDFKLSYRDLAKGKKVKSLPAAIPAEVKKEFKDLGATLREVVKGQLVRLENLMVRQFRWPVQRWRELYLAHPLLQPFGVRLVWGTYRANGQLQKAFRALDDQTLTDEQDERFELPEKEGVTIGIVHPLELSDEQRRAWATHLSDYDIQSPFLQLERPVIFPDAEQRETTMSPEYHGTDLNAMTFKGRAERIGWIRGSVCDGGGITSYRKTFPDAGAEAVLELDGMYIGIDMYENVKLGRFYFVRSGSVDFGSYTYDEPDKETDPRLIAFGDVPPIVYSEIMGDLGKIAGQRTAEEET